MSNIFKKTGKQHRFGGDLVVCPVCKIADKFTENTIRTHIYHKAKADAWDSILEGKKDTPHLDFYKQHTLSVRTKRVWTS